MRSYIIHFAKKHIGYSYKTVFKEKRFFFHFKKLFCCLAVVVEKLIEFCQRYRFLLIL